MPSTNEKPLSGLSTPAAVRPRAERLSDEALSRLILAADQQDFDLHLTEALQQLISFDLAMISTYQDDMLLEISSKSQPASLANEVLASYSTFTYRHSPFFQMHRQKIPSGFYLMEDMARHPALRRPSTKAEMLEIDRREEVGYLTAGWPKRLKEMDLALRISERDTVQIALYRTGNRGFAPDDLAAVQPIKTSLMAICQRHWQQRNARLQAARNPAQAALERFGGDRLSSREADVVLKLVAGLTEKDIAEILQVGVETIKTHRKRAYHKLGVASRVDLLVRLLGQGNEPSPDQASLSRVM